MVHDVASTDRRNPTVTANGPVYGVQEKSGDWMNSARLPIKNTDTGLRAAARGKDLPMPGRSFAPNPSVYWGNESNLPGLWFPHNPHARRQGRVWIYGARWLPCVRPEDRKKMTRVEGCPGGII